MLAFVEAANQFPPELRHAKPDPVAFSATEIVYHMMTVEALWQTRFSGLFSGSSNQFVALDPDKDAQDGEYNSLDFEAGLKGLLLMRQQTASDLKDITPDQLKLTGLHPKYGPMTAIDILKRIESHDRGHAAQFGRTLQALHTKDKA